MAKPITVFVLLSSIIIVLLSSLYIASYFSLPWASCHKRTTTTNLRLYLHDQFNRTVEYGDVYAFQDPLTNGSDPTSYAWGHCRGTIAFSNADNLQDIHVSLAYIFTDPMYNGSSVVAVGDNDVSQSVRYFPIVGGTGAFRLARGVVTGSTYSEVPPVYIYDLEIILDESRSENGREAFLAEI